MAATNSTMVPLGTTAPPFSLPDPSGRFHDLDSLYEGRAGLVVAFLSNHCPFVQLVAARLGEVASDADRVGVGMVGIMANDIDGYPDDAPAHMADRALQWGWSFPYLFDETQQVAAEYRAACTPDFFVFDADRALRYRGRFDSATPGNGETVTGAELAAAIAAVAEGGEPPAEQIASIGCNIKWKPGNEPDYFG